ncbi:MAG TPA: ATP-binding protein [Gemmatimonadaceae bacterium]|nr:ATP-binding protein [Gemmatimonadaceae bacterium]
MTATSPLASRVEILLVDDRPENLLALEAILEPLGHKLIRAQSGEDALRALLAHDFAVILLDVQMPGMNGFEVARIVKSRERTRHIPIIFLTAISKEDEYVFTGYSVGAVDYLFKPFQPEILRSKVAALVDLHLKQLKIAEQEQQLHVAERQEMELRHMRELLQSEARFRDIVGSAMDAIVAIDGKGTITLFNSTAERVFKCPVSQAVGSSVLKFFAPAEQPKVMERLIKVAGSASGKAMTPTSMQAVRANGEPFPIEASVSCMETPGGNIYTIILRDVSERVAHEERLRRQAESLAETTAELKAANEELNIRQLDLERAMTARSRFYASMSHELRTPINAVLGYSTLLLERIYGPLNDKQAEGIERTQRAARHLLELVNDVLDLSKIEAGKIDLRLQPVTFPTLVEDLFVTVRPLADEHGSALALKIDEEMRIVTDPRRVRQILLNLLSNAIKFGSGKPIDVTCAKREDGGVVIEVTDHGPGIPAQDLERIFQEFVQLGKTQLQDGTGLGLPISRRLAELLQGTLTVRSTPGEGSTFTLSLPAEVEVRAAPGADQVITAPLVEEREHRPGVQKPTRKQAEQALAASEAGRTEVGRADARRRERR